MSAAIGIGILAAIFAALVCAALYAVFGKPTSHAGEKRKQEVVNGFRLAGGFLLGFVLMGILVGCAGIAFGIAPSARVSRPPAAAIAFSAFILISLMVQRWAKYFAGFIAWGVLNSLIMASNGHLLNNPAIPVRRLYALTMSALCLVSVFASQRFTKTYSLHVAEKVALMVWISAFTLAANAERFSIPALTVGTLALVVAWWSHRSKSRRHSEQQFMGQ